MKLAPTKIPSVLKLKTEEKDTRKYRTVIQRKLRNQGFDICYEKQHINPAKTV